MASGKIQLVRYHGTIWELWYEKEDGAALNVVRFDWRAFTTMYESESGRSFYQGYNFSRGLNQIEEYFKGLKIHVENEDGEEKI